MEMLQALKTIGVLDLIFVVILSISVILGLIRGATREVLSLTGLVASIYLAFTFSEELSKTYTSQLLEDPKISYIVTFALIVIATLFATTLINLFFSQLLRASGLSFLNRLLGMVFGLLRGAVICSVVVMVLGLLPTLTSQAWWKESTLVPIFQNITRMSLQYVPPEVRDQVAETASTGVQQATAIVSGVAGANTAQPTRQNASPQSSQNTPQNTPQHATPTAVQNSPQSTSGSN